MELPSKQAISFKGFIPQAYDNIISNNLFHSSHKRLPAAWKEISPKLPVRIEALILCFNKKARHELECSHVWGSRPCVVLTAQQPLRVRPSWYARRAIVAPRIRLPTTIKTDRKYCGKEMKQKFRV